MSKVLGLSGSHGSILHHWTEGVVDPGEGTGVFCGQGEIRVNEKGWW